ncbi:MAG: ABC transporter permease subunit [Acidimicrobiales bacterium]
MREHKTVAAGFLLAITTIMVALGAVPAGATDGDPGDYVIQGVLAYDDADGERVPVVEGIVNVLDSSGAEVAEGSSDDEGRFVIPLESGGSYTAELDVDSLPEGVSLRDPDNSTRAVANLIAGQPRNVLFALVSGDAPVSSGGGGSRWDRAARLAVEGLLFGLIIAMCAVGLSLIYGTTGLVNFAHGELVTYGAILTWVFNVELGLHLFIAAPLGMIAAGISGGVLDLAFWRPLRHRGVSLTAMMIISIGVGLIGRYSMLYWFGDRSQAYADYAVQSPGSSWDLNLGFTVITPKDWIIALLAAGSLLGVAFAIKYTRLGKAMRAVSDNPALAESSGIDVDRVATAVWALGAALAALGGTFLGLTQLIRWDTGFFLLLLMFAGVTLGGLGEAFGPMVGCIIIGVMVNVITALGDDTGWRAFFQPELKNTWALWIMILILLVRPQGLFGRAERIG